MIMTAFGLGGVLWGQDRSTPWWKEKAKPWTPCPHDTVANGMCVGREGEQEAVQWKDVPAHHPGSPGTAHVEDWRSFYVQQRGLGPLTMGRAKVVSGVEQGLCQRALPCSSAVSLVLQLGEVDVCWDSPVPVPTGVSALLWDTGKARVNAGNHSPGMP